MTTRQAKKIYKRTYDFQKAKKIAPYKCGSLLKAFKVLKKKKNYQDFFSKSYLYYAAGLHKMQKAALNIKEPQV